MQSPHPLGEEFARWVDLTDNLRAQLAHASAEKAPVSAELAKTAKQVRDLSRSLNVWTPSPDRAH